MSNGMSDAKEVKGFRRMSYLPRLGKIRLGVIVKTAKGIEYPKEVEYFVVPPEVANIKDFEGNPIYGEKPTLLDIILPSDDQHTIIPFSYKKYGSNQKLQCKGDGETGTAFDFKTGEIEEKTCPCEDLENKKCSLRGHFMVILPRVSLGGVYQIDIGSVVNLNRILNVIDYYKSIAGRIKGIPITLERVPEKMGDKTGKMQTHYLFRFGTNINIDALNLAIEKKDHFLAMEYKIEQPIEEGKLSDTPVVLEGEITDEEKNKTEIDKTDSEIDEETKAQLWLKINATQKQISKAKKDFDFKVFVRVHFPKKPAIFKGSDFTVLEMELLLDLLQKQDVPF